MKLGIFLPGRLASERLPNKLILPIGNVCLWEIACKKLSELPEAYEKAVLICDDKLITIAKKYPNISIIRRSKASANKDGPLVEIFGGLKAMKATHLMFLNPCLAFLTKETILEALDSFELNQVDYATSVLGKLNLHVPLIELL